MKSRQIIKQVLKDHLLGAEDFFSRQRIGCYVAARMDAAKRLQAVGFSVNQIARFMRRNNTTIAYYLYPNIRQNRKDRKAKEWSRKVVLRILEPDVRAIVLEYADAECVNPETIIAKRMREWAHETARERASA